MSRRLNLRIAAALLLETDSGQVYRLTNLLYIPPRRGLTCRQWWRLLTKTWMIPYGCG